MKRTRFAAETCPVARAVDVVGDWWSLLIVRDALLGTRRFSDFEKSLGVAKNILSDRLRKLVAAGVLEIRPAGENAARHEYGLTELGSRLLPVIVALGQWAGCEVSDFRLVERKTGKPVLLVFRTTSGRTLASHEVQMVPVVDSRINQ